MYIYSSNEIDKRINVPKIANNISTMGDNTTVPPGLYTAGGAPRVVREAHGGSGSVSPWVWDTAPNGVQGQSQWSVSQTGRTFVMAGLYGCWWC